MVYSRSSWKSVAGSVVAGGLVASAFLPAGAAAGERPVTEYLLAGYTVRYLQRPLEPAPEDTVFWVIAYPVEGGGLAYLMLNGTVGITERLPLNSEGESVLLIFTSPFRAFEYGRSAPDVRSPFTTHGWTAEMCARRLVEIREQTAVRLFTLDPSSGCPGFTTHDASAGMSDSTLCKLWLASRVIVNALGQKHYTRVLESVEDGEYRSAMQPLGELIDCVVPEEPRLHILAGACGIALGDEGAIDRAVAALRWLDPAIAERLAWEATGASGGVPQDRAEAARRAMRLVEHVKAPVLQPWIFPAAGVGRSPMLEPAGATSGLHPAVTPSSNRSPERHPSQLRRADQDLRFRAVGDIA